MPRCTTHPEVETSMACHRCARPFCQACLAELLGGHYCTPCKAEVVRGMQRGPQRSPLAALSLGLSAVSFVLCGALAPFLSAVSLALGFRALGESEQLRPGGRHDLEWAAIVLSGATIALWLLGYALGFLVWIRS